jgi:hypothetical protein
MTIGEFGIGQAEKKLNNNLIGAKKGKTGLIFNFFAFFFFIFQPIAVRHHFIHVRFLPFFDPLSISFFDEFTRSLRRNYRKNAQQQDER